MYAELRRAADSLGVPERGVQVVARMHLRMRAVAERAGALPRARVACLGGIEPLRLADPWTHELLRMAGGEDALAGVTATRDGVLAPARLAAADPDAVWIAPPGLGLARVRDGLVVLDARPWWRALRAVREGRVFLGDGRTLFLAPGPRVVESLECLAEALHPSAFRFGHEGRGWARHA